MDENPSPQNQPDQNPTLRHEKTITPVDDGLRPEDAVPKITVQPQSEIPAAAPPQAAVPDVPSDTTPSADQPAPSDAGQFKAGRFWAGRILKVVVAGLVGLVVGVSYFAYLDGSADLWTRGTISLHSYSPFSIILETILSSLILMLIYGLILRFILRAKRPASQALVSILASQLLIIVVLQIEHFNNQAVSIFGGTNTVPLVIAGCIGAVTFAVTSYMSERAWTWRISRQTLAASVLIAVFILSSGLSFIISGRHNNSVKQEAAISDQVKADEKVGIYDFNADYKQYYPSDAIQARFTVVRIAGSSKIKDPKEDQGPHITSIEFKDKDYTGTDDALTINLWESKPPSSYNPPSNCGNPNPSQEYFDLKNNANVSEGKCYKISDILGIGTLYGRDQYTGAFNSEKVPDSYDWYYIQYGDTLITLDTVSTLNGDDTASLIKSLQPITANNLLEKSKALATSQN